MRTLLVAALCFATSAAAVEPMVPYDNFNPGAPNPPTQARVHGIDWTRWSARDVGGGVGQVRKQAGMRLRLRHQSTAPSGALGVAFIAPSAVSAIEATAVLIGARAVGCGGKSSEVEARIGGAFFNVGTPVRGSAVGDVRAWVRLTRSSADAPHAALAATAVVEQCTNATCSTSTVVFSQSLGTVADELQSALRITWDATANQFIFGRDQVPSVSFTYRLDDSSAPTVAVKSLEAAQRLPQCAGAQAAVNAYFHAVSVNRSAAPVL